MIVETLELEQQTTSGAIGALKGYRVQALYTIYHILANELNTYVPEGHEDLDILNASGQVDEFIQIKNYSEPLILSNIIALNGTSFLGRCLEKIREGTKAKFTLVSFGAVGPELKKLFSDQTTSEQFRERLQKYSSDSESLELLKSNVEIVECNETEIEKRTVDLLKSSGLNADPKLSLDLLHFWIYKLSEQRKSLDKHTLMKKIADVGKYETARTRYYDHYQISIKSFAEKIPTSADREKLGTQYYRGVAARYEHIQAQYDVIRPDYLREINSKLKSSHAVVIHGASGQGKSTLAYRYIHDFYTEELAFQVELSGDFQFTLEQIATLSGMANAIEIPILLYLDVPPGNTMWVRFLKELSVSNSVKFIVTIREDDWTRSPGKGIEFEFDDLELALTENEARHIYIKLSSSKPDLTFTDFDEAWLHFGGSGPLLEFTYLVTQGGSLEMRLKEQVTSITDSEIKEVLRLVALSDSLGAKVNVRELAQGNLRLQDIIVSLEKEFLVRSIDEGNSLVGLHPVRSTILARILIDNFTLYTKDYVIKCLHLIQEGDRYTFLVNAFLVCDMDIADFDSELLKIKTTTWSGRNGILQSLLWKGVADYVKRNEETFSEAHELLSDAWYTSIRMNFADTGIPSNFLQSSGMELTAETIEAVEAISQKQSSLEEIYFYSKTWLSASTFSDVEIKNERHAQDFAEFAYWSEKLAPEVKIEFDPSKLLGVFGECSLETMCNVLLGASSILDATKLKELQKIFILKLRAYYRIPIVELNDEHIKLHFLIDLLGDIESGTTTVHERTIEIVDIARKAIPNLKYYCTQGYGHHVKLLPGSDKTTKRIPVSALPLPNLVELNIRTINLFEYRYRPDNWKEYTQTVIDRRNKNVAFLKRFNDALGDFIKTENLQLLLSFVESCNVVELKAPEVLLPKNVSDPSGTVSERNSNKREKNNSTYTMQLLKLKAYQKAYFNYSSSFSTALSFALATLTDRVLSKDRKPNERKALIYSQETFEKLPEFQQLFITHFSKFSDSPSLHVLNVQEAQQLKLFVGLWRTLLLNKTKFVKNGFNSVASELKSTQSDFEKKLKAALKKTAKENAYEIKLHRNKENNSTYIVVNVTDPLQILSSLQHIASCIHSCIGSSDATSTKSFMLSNYYSKFTVAPSVFGKLINRSVYEFPLYIFQTESFQGLKSYHTMPHTAANWFLNQTNMEVYEDHFEEFKLLDHFVLQYSNLSTLVGQVAQTKAVAENELIDQLGLEIITKYGQNFRIPIESSYTYVHDYLGRHIRDYSELNGDYSSISAEDIQFIEVLTETYNGILPPADPEKCNLAERSLSLGEFQKWKDCLDSISDKILIIYYYTLKKEIFDLWRCEKQPFSLERRKQ